MQENWRRSARPRLPVLRERERDTEIAEWREESDLGYVTKQRKGAASVYWL